ncbi:hypothetical protein VAA_02018 [Vibrio anguillarum 775]|nr:hypothetical protein VAA_02018 [Vibrio anguillarum 775]ARV25656.1 hypothetical protein A6A12_1063 [Vibrio anguillarum]
MAHGYSKTHIKIGEISLLSEAYGLRELHHSNDTIKQLKWCLFI